MQQKQYFIIACVVLVAVMLGTVGLVYMWLPDKSPGTVANPGQEAAAKPEVHLYRKAGGLVLQWNNLPKGTQRVTIYRSELGTEDWKHWKTFDIDATTIASGFIEIKTNEDMRGYSFYAEAVATGTGNSSSTGGEGSETIVLWQSSSTVVEDIPPKHPAITGISPTSTAPGTNTTTTPSTPAPETPSPSTTSTTQTPSSTTQGSQSTTTTGVYYAPDGTITGTIEIQRNDFWVDHINRSIEVGWQHLPSGTKEIVVYRSQQSAGPWLELFRQADPVSPSSLRVLDNTLYTAHYYRMDARSSAGILKSYDPVFLPAYE